MRLEIYMLDPYEVAKNSKPFYRSRINELIWLLDRVAKKGLPDTEFLVAIHDCVQTINKPHTYRGAHFQESSPTFTIVACNFSDNVPFPMWEGDEKRGGGFKGWDAKMEDYKRLDTTPWAKKASKAVFRGGNRPSMFFADKADADARCDDVGRSRLSYLSKENPELFNVSLSGQCGKSTFSMSPLSEADHHSFKYILYAEGNCFWADRLNKFVFGPSAIVKQETPCGQFWEPLLQPMTHYLPTDFFFSDTTDRIKWGNEHSEEVQNIVKNANEFAENYLSLSGIEAYVEVLLTEYTTLLQSKVIKVEKGAIEAPVEA
jgi:Glycosyl transferase family 90